MLQNFQNISKIEAVQRGLDLDLEKETYTRALEKMELEKKELPNP